MVKTSKTSLIFQISKMQDTAVKCRSLLLLVFDSSNEGLDRKEMAGWNKLLKTETDLVLFGYASTKCFWNKPAVIPTAYLLVSELVHLRWAIITKSWNYFFKWNGYWWVFRPFFFSVFESVSLCNLFSSFLYLQIWIVLSSAQLQDHTGTNQ